MATKKFKWTGSDTMFSIAVLFAVGAFTLFVTFAHARDTVRAERVDAWNTMTEESSDPREKDLMVFLSDRIMRCATKKARGPSRSAPPFTLYYSTYEVHFRVEFVAHEQACLAHLRGEAMVSSPEGQEMIAGISVPL